MRQSNNTDFSLQRPPTQTPYELSTVTSPEIDDWLKRVLQELPVQYASANSNRGLETLSDPSASKDAYRTPGDRTLNSSEVQANSPGMDHYSEISENIVDMRCAEKSKRSSGLAATGGLADEVALRSSSDTEHYMNGERTAKGAAERTPLHEKEAEPLPGLMSSPARRMKCKALQQDAQLHEENVEPLPGLISSPARRMGRALKGDVPIQSPHSPSVPAECFGELSPAISPFRKGREPRRVRCASYYDEDILPHMSPRMSKSAKIGRRGSAHGSQ